MGLEDCDTSKTEKARGDSTVCGHASSQQSDPSHAPCYADPRRADYEVQRSKIDLRSGYHQLVLHPSSRYITTFSTNVGLYIYKRLSFGVNAAVEVFQHEIQSVIQGVPGAMDISDNIAVFGVDQQAHDDALTDVLKKLTDAGLTANLEKCEFNKTGMEFFVLIFSKDDVSPDPQQGQGSSECS